MNKSLLASAIALGLGTAGTADALTVSVTQMIFNGSHGVVGDITSNGTGAFTSTGTFFGQPWTATATTFFSAGAGASTWAGTAPAGAYSYTFSLSANQVAWGTLFDWNSNPLIPVLNIMTCTGFTGAGEQCTGTGTPMQTPPFSGQAPQFNGTVSAASAAVPVPAAAWLLGSGLVGLAGVARRNKKKEA